MNNIIPYIKCTISLILAAIILAGCTTKNLSTSSTNTASVSSVLSSNVSSVIKNTSSTKTSSKLTSSKSTSSKKSAAINVSGDTSSKKPVATAQYNPNSIYPKVDTYTPVPSNQYLFYSNLSASLQSAYKVLCENVQNMASGLIPLGKISKNEVSLLYTAVKSDHPEYFWLPNTYVVSSSGGYYSIGFDYKSADVSVSYLVTPAQRAAMSKEIQEKIIEVYNLLKQNQKLIDNNRAKYTIELLIHDWLVSKVNYDTAAANDPDRNPDAFTVYGALVKGKAVCEGYSRAMQILLNFFGLNCSLVTGDSKGLGHMWNIVNVNGYWYHLDATWNDYNSDNGFSHGYFNVSDTMIKRDHTIDADYSKLSEDDSGLTSFNYNLPVCGRDYYSYHRINGTMFDNVSDIELIMTEGIFSAAQDKKTRCEFAFSDKCTAYYTDAGQLANSVKLNAIFNNVNARLNSSGIKITLKDIMVNKNGSFVVNWTLN